MYNKTASGLAGGGWGDALDDLKSPSGLDGHATGFL
jgi:hypothetical protein